MTVLADVAVPLICTVLNSLEPSFKVTVTVATHMETAFPSSTSVA